MFASCGGSSFSSHSVLRASRAQAFPAVSGTTGSRRYAAGSRRPEAPRPPAAPSPTKSCRTIPRMSRRYRRGRSRKSSRHRSARVERRGAGRSERAGLCAERRSGGDRPRGLAPVGDVVRGARGGAIRDLQGRARRRVEAHRVVGKTRFARTDRGRGDGGLVRVPALELAAEVPEHVAGDVLVGPSRQRRGVHPRGARRWNRIADAHVPGTRRFAPVDPPEVDPWARRRRIAPDLDGGRDARGDSRRRGWIRRGVVRDETAQPVT